MVGARCACHGAFIEFFIKVITTVECTCPIRATCRYVMLAHGTLIELHWNTITHTRHCVAGRPLFVLITGLADATQVNPR